MDEEALDFRVRGDDLEGLGGPNGHFLGVEMKFSRAKRRRSEDRERVFFLRLLETRSRTRRARDLHDLLGLGRTAHVQEVGLGFVFFAFETPLFFFSSREGTRVLGEKDAGDIGVCSKSGEQATRRASG